MKLNRGGILSGLAGDDAKQIERIDVAGSGLKNLAVQRLRFGELAGAVVGHRSLKLAADIPGRGGLRLRRSGLCGGTGGRVRFVFHARRPLCSQEYRIVPEGGAVGVKSNDDNARSTDGRPILCGAIGRSA